MIAKSVLTLQCIATGFDFKSLLEVGKIRLDLSSHGRYTRVVFWGMRTTRVQYSYDQSNYRTRIVRTSYVVVTILQKVVTKSVRPPYDTRTIRVRRTYGR